jgi:hypothetical protein
MAYVGLRPELLLSYSQSNLTCSLCSQHCKVHQFTVVFGFVTQTWLAACYVCARVRGPSIQLSHV